MTLELINTGSELMLGRVLNTHQQWLCRQLADLGYVVNRQVAVADTADDIERAVQEALGRADFIITTGGLGPTSDDITRDRIAALLGRKLHEDPAIVAHVESFFAKRNRPMPASTRVQAMVPDGALVLNNAHGTAPGLALHVSSNPFRPDGRPSWLVMLPGPPRELRPMFTNQVAPLLKEKLPLHANFVCRTLRTVGLGESFLEERIASPLKSLTDSGLELGYCAHSGAVDVRFVGHGSGAEANVTEAARIVYSLVGEYVFGEGDDEMAEVLVRQLTDQKKTLALAESCTGGFISNRITNVPGASAVLLAGLVTYSNAAKQSFLGVKAETLATHGAVSEAVAREMAEGCRARTGADFAIGVTGIAGPGGGAPEKPVGTLFIALAMAAGTKVINPVNRYDRETFKHLTCLQALELLRRVLAAGP